jgi:hypothetical protein
MPLAHVIHPDYRDQNEVSRYPFADNANCVSADGRVEIDPTIFVDASLYPVGGDERLYISQIDVAPREVTIYIGSAARPRLVSVAFDPYDDETFLLPLRDAYERDAGILVSEPSKLRIFAAWPNGTHLFRILATSFVAACCIPTPEVGVRGILTEAGELLQGDVWIIGDNGVVVREVAGELRIDIVGDPLFLRRRCAPLDLFDPPQFLLSINDCGPDDYGNFNLTVDSRLADKTVLRIYPAGTTLRATLVGRRVQG